jgi:hypothetical protein
VLRIATPKVSPDLDIEELRVGVEALSDAELREALGAYLVEDAPHFSGIASPHLRSLAREVELFQRAAVEVLYSLGCELAGLRAPMPSSERIVSRGYAGMRAAAVAILEGQAVRVVKALAAKRDCLRKLDICRQTAMATGGAGFRPRMVRNG